MAALPGAVESAYIVESVLNATDGDNTDKLSIIGDAIRLAPRHAKPSR